MPAQKETTTLQDVNDLLHMGSVAGRQPSKVADLRPQESKFPKGYAAIKSGDVVVLWGTPLLGEGEVGPNEKILAYDKDVPSSGGWVLMSAGTIKKMSSAEFEAAPKAGKK